MYVLSKLTKFYTLNVCGYFSYINYTLIKLTIFLIYRRNLDLKDGSKDDRKLSHNGNSKASIHSMIIACFLNWSIYSKFILVMNYNWLSVINNCQELLRNGGWEGKQTQYLFTSLWGLQSSEKEILEISLVIILNDRNEQSW